MSYSKRLESFILEMKGGVFFLSPRERMFLDYLEEMGVPEEVVREGIARCYTSLNPRRRSKYPLFLCFKTVMEEYENYLRLEAQKVSIDWRRRFEKKISLVRDYLEKDVPVPENEESAQEILKEIEREIVRRLWRSMDREERKRIKEKYREFENRRDIYGELIKREVQRIYGIPNLSLYVD